MMMWRWITFILIAILIIVICSSASAEIYQWKDKQGNVHFGDRPPPESKAKQLPIKSENLNVSPKFTLREKSKPEVDHSKNSIKSKPKKLSITEYNLSKRQCFDKYKGNAASDDAQVSDISNTLSDADINSLTRLFKNLSRRWDGNLIKTDCLGTTTKPEIKKEAFKTRMSGKWSLTGKLELEINYQNNETSSRKHYYWWLIEDSKLYFGDRRDIRPALKWVIDVVSISSDRLVFRKKISRTNRRGAAIKHTQVIEVYTTSASMSMTELLYDRGGVLVSVSDWNLQ